MHLDILTVGTVIFEAALRAPVGHGSTTAAASGWDAAGAGRLRRVEAAGATRHTLSPEVDLTWNGKARLNIEAHIKNVSAMALPGPRALLTRTYLCFRRHLYLQMAIVPW
jgi:hypothetical protein